MSDTVQHNEIFPIGTMSPSVYIVGETPGAIMGQPGTYLQKITRSLGLDTETNLRMFSISRRWGEVDDEYKSQSSRFVLADLTKTKPKVIIGLGAGPSELIAGVKGKVSDLRGSVQKITVEDHECYFITTYHPSYILNNAGNTAIMRTFLGDLRKAIAASEGKVDSNSEKDLRIALTADEFERFVLNEYKADDETAYDIETNGADQLSDRAKVVGFSVAPDEVKGIYVILEALEYKMPEEDIERCKDILRNLLNERKVIVHNQLYERPYTLNKNWLGMDLHDNIDDTMVMSRLMLGGKTGAGLKDQCRLNLGYTKWSEDLDRYLGRFNKIQDNLAPTNAGSLRNEHKVLMQERTIKGLAEYMVLQLEQSLNTPDKEGNPKTTDVEATLEMIKSVLYDSTTPWSDITDMMERFKVFDKRTRNLAVASCKMVTLISQFYTTEEEYNHIDKLIAEAILDRLERDDYSFVSYGLVPVKIIAPYGALDAVGTVDLKKYYYKRMEEESKALDMDLFKGYSNWMKHFKMAYVMERNGAFWNEELVKKERDFLEGTAIQATRTLHSSPLMGDFLVDKKAGQFATFIVTNMPDAISRSAIAMGKEPMFIADIRTKKRSKTKKEVVFSNGEVYEMANGSILELLTPEELEIAKKEWLVYINAEVFSKFTTIKEFKDYFNPGSPANKAFLGKILVNDEVRASKFLYEMKNKLFTQDNFSVDNYPATDRMFLKGVMSVIERMAGVKKAVADLDEDEIIDNPEWADLDEESTVVVEKISAREGFLEYLEILKNCRLQSPDLIQMFAECLNYELPGTKEPDIIKLHEIYQLMGIDIEDESLWNEEYKFLYNFRLYKKCMKLVSSYITGKLGYENAWVVDQETLNSGENFVPRKVKYKSQGLQTKPGQVVLLQTDFSPCSAETGRWRAGIHTIPFGSSIKELYTSRFVGGTIAAPDFSQMEIRAMAGAANDQKLLAAFLRGDDIHRFNAQQIFNREDVTDIERRFSKMASFCFTGDTKVPLVNGTVKTMEDLYREYSDNPVPFNVYSTTLQGKPVAGTAHSVAITGYESELVEVTLDDGSSIKCTPNHLWLTRDGVYVEARDLVEGQSLMPFYQRIHSDKWRNKYHQVWDTESSKWVWTHEQFSPVSRGQSQVIHHSNFNKYDNRPHNLMTMDFIEHRILHQKHSSDLMKECWKRPDYRKVQEEKLTFWREVNLADPDKRARMLSGLLDWDEDRRRAQSDRMELEAQDYKNSRQYRGLLSKHVKFIRRLIDDDVFYPQVYDELRPATFYIKYENLEDVLGFSIEELVKLASVSDPYNGDLGFDAEGYSKAMSDMVAKFWSSPEYEEKRQAHSERTSKVMSDLNKSEGFQVKTKKAQILKKLKTVASSHPDLTPTLYTQVKKNYPGHNFSLRTISKYFGSFEVALEESKQYNHSVAGIRVINYDSPVPVYDFTVDGYHNFAILGQEDSGVYVHNSILYGASEYSVAKNYFKGDIKAAEELFHNFYSAFPDVKKFIEDRHREMEMTGKVKLLTNRFLNITPKTMEDKDVAKAKRNAQFGRAS